MTTTAERLSRRNLLKSAAAGTGAMALASCAPDYYDGPDVSVARVHESAPTTRTTIEWLIARPTRSPMGPQDLVLPMEPATSVTDSA